jgi:hypothetical protein
MRVLLNEAFEWFSVNIHCSGDGNAKSGYAQAVTLGFGVSQS